MPVCWQSWRASGGQRTIGGRRTTVPRGSLTPVIGSRAAEQLSQRPDLVARLDSTDHDYLAACRTSEDEKLGGPGALPAGRVAGREGPSRSRRASGVGGDHGEGTGRGSRQGSARPYGGAAKAFADSAHRRRGHAGGRRGSGVRIRERQHRGEASGRAYQRGDRPEVDVAGSVHACRRAGWWGRAGAAAVRRGASSRSDR